MWFDKENRIKKDMIIISKEELLKLKKEIILSNNETQIEIIDRILEISKIEMNEIKDNTYVSLNSEITSPYLEGLVFSKENEWNPNYNQNEECECGDPYYRHFDTYEKMEAVGCKYCECYYFKPKT